MSLLLGVLCHFQQSFSHIMTVAACCMRHDSARVLNAVNTDAPRSQTQYTNAPPILSSQCRVLSEETASTNFRTWDLPTARRTLLPLGH